MQRALEQSWKRYAVMGALCCVAILAPFALVSAAIVPCDGGDACRACDLARLGHNIISFLITMSALLGAIFVMYAGYLLVTAQGNRGKIEEARSIFTDVVVGIIFIMASYLIVNTIMKMLVDPQYISGSVWDSEVIQCVPTPRPIDRGETPVTSLSVVPGAGSALQQFNEGANDGSAGTGPNGNGTPGTRPEDGMSADDARARLREAGVSTQVGVDMDGVSQARIDQIAKMAADCSIANGGTASSNACNVQVSSGFRPGSGQSNHGTGDAVDISGRSDMFNNWMQSQGMSPTFGGYQGATYGGGTCTYHPNETQIPGQPTQYHWHCSSNGR